MKAIDWAFAQDLDGKAKMILVYLARRANDNGVCFPSHRLIAEECGCSMRTVSRALTTLREAGLVEGDRRGTNHTREPKFYTLVGWLRGSDTPPVASLDTTPVADRSVSKKTSGVLRTPSGSRTGSLNRRKAAIRAEQADWDDLDPSAAAEEAMGEAEPLPAAPKPRRWTPTTLATHFRHSMNVPFSKASHRPLMVNIKAWLVDGITADEVAGMIEAFADDPKIPDGQLPYQAFINQRARLLAVVRRQQTAAEMEDHRHDDGTGSLEEYWLGPMAGRNRGARTGSADTVPPTDTTKDD
jgi:DNA-binding transcriptional ArsR family regulator